MNQERNDIEVILFDSRNVPTWKFEIFGFKKSLIKKLNEYLEEYYMSRPFDEGYYELFQQKLKDKFIKLGTYGVSSVETLEDIQNGVTISSWKYKIIR